MRISDWSSDVCSSDLLDTCPVGVATQNPVLRERFTGKPEFVVNFMEFIAAEVREYLAELGFRSLEEAVGHAELLDVNGAIEHWKADGLDLTPILEGPQFARSEARREGKECVSTVSSRGYTSQ